MMQLPLLVVPQVLFNQEAHQVLLSQDPQVQVLKYQALSLMGFQVLMPQAILFQAQFQPEQQPIPQLLPLLPLLVQPLKLLIAQLLPTLQPSERVILARP